MPYRTHVLPAYFLKQHAVRVTMQRYDQPLRHDVVLNARKTTILRALTRRVMPVTIARGFEVRRDGVVIGVLLQPYDRLPCYRHKTWFGISVEGPQTSCYPDLFWSTCELYWATWRAEQAAIKALELKAKREAPPVPAEERLARRREAYRDAQRDAKALSGLTFI